MMKRRFKFRNWKQIRLKKVDATDLSDRLLLANVYFTQGLILLICWIVLIFQGRSLLELLTIPQGYMWLLLGCGLAAVVVAADLIVNLWVPDDVLDDGGINERIFRNLSLWHIIELSLVVAVCEELLFRGAIQYALGTYWTSVLFAAIHVRYLRHWLMTGFVFLTSYALGWAYEYTDTLWTPILAHFVIDVVMGCVIRYRRDS